MKAKEAAQLGEQIAALVREDRIDRAYARLAPILAGRIPFSMLERMGAPVGQLALDVSRSFAARVAAEETEGGWVVIGAILREQLECDPAGAFEHCRHYIIAADIWYGADILGERVPGPALMSDFDTALALLTPWRMDENRWVRRTVGVAVHFWAKRAHGDLSLTPKAGQLLDFLEPMFAEWEMEAVKGVGWGLKTLGKYYPDLMVDWLPRQIQRKHRAVLVRKATTVLPVQAKEKILEISKS